MLSTARATWTVCFPSRVAFDTLTIVYCCSNVAVSDKMSQYRSSVDAPSLLRDGTDCRMHFEYLLF